MAAEEVHHRTMLFDLYRSKFGDYLPLIRRQDVKGFVHHKPLWYRLVFVDDDGRFCTIASAFTDIDTMDEFRRIAAGRAAFRTADLLALFAHDRVQESIPSLNSWRS
jgi:hypothetical protein